jgi:hypothetical protein
MKDIIWFTRESWKYMAGRDRLVRFLTGYPRALWRFMHNA